MIYHLRIAVSEALIWCLDRTLPKGDVLEGFMDAIHEGARRGWREARTIPTSELFPEEES